MIKILHRFVSSISFSKIYSRRLAAELCVILIAVLCTYFLSISLFANQFTVIYSLDQRKNDQEIIRIINDADKYVYFAIYYFTKENIAQALIRAKEKGKIVVGITDAAARLSSNKKIIDSLENAGVLVGTQRHMDGIMHLKMLVTDKAYASGSYNWTETATQANDEVLEIGTNKKVHDQYLRIIKRVLGKNVSYHE